MKPTKKTMKTIGLTLCVAVALGWAGAGDASARSSRPGAKAPRTPFPGYSKRVVVKWYQQNRRAALGRPAVRPRPSRVARSAKRAATVRVGTLYNQLRSGWQPRTRAQYDRAARTIGSSRQALGAGKLGGLRANPHLSWTLNRLKSFEPRFYK
jgi:hypothetical protein